MRLMRSAVMLVLAAGPALSQQPAPARPAETGWEFFGLPALNFSSDEGFGYGALLELYNYGDGVQPYRFMVRPLMLFTTKGRRDFVVLFDAPRLLPNGWRFDALIGREKHLATPYYGVGNATVHDESLEEPPNDYYYRYGRSQWRVAGNVQASLSKHARLLVGASVANLKTDPIPFDSGTTLFARDFGATGVSDKIFTVRTGVVLDTRDREIGARSGHWVDALIQYAPLASDDYARLTFTGRKYVSLTGRLVFAQRLAAQVTTGSVPVYDLSTFQMVSGQSEALGGSGSVRGIPKNRYIGGSAVFSNSELRWRFVEMTLLGKPAYLVASGFVDAGRVWPKDMALGELFSDLHAGYGGGLRLGLGPSFLVAFDLGKSSESTQIYIGLGYPF